MIEGFDIDNFGSFRRFRWNTVRDTPGNNVAKFKKLNILYGRNCSGKTTLSRILRCLETGQLPSNYDTPSFSVLTGEGTYTQADIPSTKHAIRVYNKDFVEKHLGFLRRDDGTIEPFATIGQENKEIEERIAAHMQQLGSVEGNAGLLFEHDQAKVAADRAQRNLSDAEQALEATLTKKATNSPDGMKHRTKFGDINYNKAKLRADIQTAKDDRSLPLNDDKTRELEVLVDERALPQVTKNISFTSRLTTMYADSTNLLVRKIEPTAPIQELLNDAVLQAWVREGMPYHRGKRETCGFCQQPLPPGLWEKLDAHFNKQSVRLGAEIASQLELLNSEERALHAIGAVEPSSVYTGFRDGLAKQTAKLNAQVAVYRANLTRLATSLRGRSNKIFEVQQPPMLEDNSLALAETIAAINGIVSQSNAKALSLEADQKAAKARLRLSEAARFSADIDFEAAETKNTDLRMEAERLAELATQAEDRVRKLGASIHELRERQRDEKRGAQRINDFLSKHFGHQALRLESVEDGQSQKFRFRVVRGTEIAYNLSEGECSLVAFCYFLAKLEDTDTHGKNVIVWIDDPISSLDSNHIFFVFSLIESQLARHVKDVHGQEVCRYEQLFISTHSLEFLKYLGRLTGPPHKSTERYVVSQRASGSLVEWMPMHLRLYSTEFNYLFSEIYTCIDPANDATHHHCFYGFGNNLRRFLEAYLFFKYPTLEGGQNAHEKRVTRFFSGDVSAEAIVQRLMNEYSHLGMFDRSMQPIDCDEIAKVSRFVIGKIKLADPDQYTCLLESIGKHDLL
jgi:wobble nucleotide-excising tRNase